MAMVSLHSNKKLTKPHSQYSEEGILTSISKEKLRYKRTNNYCNIHFSAIIECLDTYSTYMPDARVYLVYLRFYNMICLHESMITKS